MTIADRSADMYESFASFSDVLNNPSNDGQLEMYWEPEEQEPEITQEERVRLFEQSLENEWSTNMIDVKENLGRKLRTC